jgi:RNA polymerase sigma-70 factor, ECF subfamily
MEAWIDALAPDPEELLLRRAAAGDVGALEEVARSWRTRIRRWALLELGNEALAEDAAQDAFVQLIRCIHQYDPDRPFGPWLKAVVRNCCHRVRKLQSRHVHELLEEETQEDTQLRAMPTAGPSRSSDPEGAVDLKRTTTRALEAFSALTPRQREVMHLCTQDGLTAAEAARELGLAPSTARVLLFKARQTLLAALGWTDDL